MMSQIEIVTFIQLNLFKELNFRNLTKHVYFYSKTMSLLNVIKPQGRNVHLHPSIMYLKTTNVT